jgi:GAF domain-containing protein
MSEAAENKVEPPVPVLAGQHTGEHLYFRLLLRGLGLDPKGFKLWKFVDQQTRRIRVRIFGRGSGAAYDVPETESWTPLFARDLKRGRFDLHAPSLLNEEGLQALDAIADECAQSGVTATLQTLNRRVPHRFTAVYKLSDKVMRNIVLVDKANSLDSFSLQAVPLENSFCQFVLKDGFFLTCHSGGDPRLEGHPYSGIVGSYIGVPIPDGAGGLFGTLCHFDFHDQPIAEQEFYLLERVARILRPHLPT